MPESRASRFTLSWRVGVPHYETDAAFADLMGQVHANIDWLDEIAFFDSVTHHLYLPLDVFAERAAILKRRIVSMREAGVRSVGINVLATLGHLDEAHDTMPPLPFQPMVGMDGALSSGCGCPNSPELRDYIGAKYALMAGAGPDFIWVDDDVRMNNHGVAFACFCPVCLAILSKTLARPFDRASLVESLNDPAQGDVREAWVQQNSDTIASLMAHVSEAIRAVDAGIATGLMTAGAGDLYTGADVPRWMRALGGTKLRPGGGFYNDATPSQMIGKALDVGRGARIAARTPEIADTQYELENFPYQRFRKSATALISECTLALATGCNGVALNMLPMWGGPFGDCEAFLPAVRNERPAWERLVAHVAGGSMAGLWIAWHPKLLARRRIRPGQSWLEQVWDHGVSTSYVLAEIGLPLSVESWQGDRPPEFGAVLSGRVAEAFTDEELRTMLSGGVLMDTAALDVLTERGFGELTGVRTSKRLSNGAMERFTDDPLNGVHAGQIRDARIEFWGDARGKGDVLEPVAEGVRVIAEMHDYFRRPIGPCLSAFENALGGRIVVAGYAPWMFLQSVAKREQLQNVVDWLTRGSAPVRVCDPAPLAPLVRISADRRRAAVVLLNAGLDPIGEATLLIRLAGRERSVKVAGMAAWSTATVLVG